MSVNEEKKEFSIPQLSDVDELSKALFRVSKELEQKNKLLDIQNKRLEEQNKKLLRNEKERTDLYANLSHDLRAPISAVCNSVEYILNIDKYKESDISDTLRLIYSRSKGMERMINDIFLMSRVDNKSINIVRQKINIKDFIEEYYYMICSDKMYDKRRLFINISEEVDDCIVVDPEYFARVLDNLYSNSLKYSKEGDFIEIGAYMSDANKVIVYVKDSGIGIDKNEIDRVFERSYIVNKSRTPGKNNSFGIGLAIVKGIVELFGGFVWCESTYGKETTMKIELDRVK